MAINAIGQCAPCCKQLRDDCDTCSKCLPKYLCVYAEATPDYGDSGCHCSTVNGRIFSSSAFCGWYGVVSCASDSLTFRVYVERNESGDCQTVVEATEFEASYTFAGVLDGITFSGSYNGMSYDVGISAADMVVNPLAFGDCPICVCAACLPKAFCVIYHNYQTGEILTGTLPWMCESQSYDAVTVGDQTVAITLSNESCELAVTATAGMAIISLESDGSSGPSDRGVACLESPGILTRGTAPFSTVAQPGFLTATIEVFSGKDFVGTLTVHEKPCEGECSACGGEGAGLNCCPVPPDALTCTATLLDDEGNYCCQDMTFSIPYNPAGDRWEVFGIEICGYLWDVVLLCGIGSHEGFSMSVISQSEPHGFQQNKIPNRVDCPGVLFVVTGRLRMFSRFDDPGCTWEWVVHS